MKKLFPFFTTTRLALVFTLSIAVAAVSCKDDDPGPSANNEYLIVNNWILDNMNNYYLWNTDLPPSPDKTLEPEAFFKSLLSDQDRFSWIQDNYQELLNSLQGITKEAGFEFILYRESASSSNVIGQIVYIKPNSPASSAGLKRGDVFSAINSQQITVDNYQTLIGQLSSNFTLKYKPYDVDAQTFGSELTISLQPIQYSENPNFMSKVIETGGKKIGYYVYNFFANGVDDGSEYDNQMETIFANFKSQGITDLVLDLRYNSGGAETAAISLASYIGKGVDNTKVFAKKEYNSEVEDEILSEPNGASYLTSKFQTKASNVGSMLNGGRVYILTGSRTASASELVINGLKPYMDVFLIGDVTVGKNVGSISIYEEDDPEITWGMQPIVVKIYNSLDQSDYSNGFTPNVVDEDNSIKLYPLGDTREALLAHAIAQITGTATGGRVDTSSKREAVGHSLDIKRRANQLVIDQNIPLALKH